MGLHKQSRTSSVGMAAVGTKIAALEAADMVVVVMVIVAMVGKDGPLEVEDTRAGVLSSAPRQRPSIADADGATASSGTSTSSVDFIMRIPNETGATLFDPAQVMFFLSACFKDLGIRCFTQPNAAKGAAPPSPLYEGS